MTGSKALVAEGGGGGDIKYGTLFMAHICV